MFIREERVVAPWITKSKLGNEFIKNRTRSVYHLKCNGCDREYTRDKGVSGVGITTRAHHFCELCDQRSLSGKVAKTIRTDQCRERVGETRLGEDGYPEIYVGPDYEYKRDRKRGGYYWLDVHVFVIQEHLGRVLTRAEVVHHIDGDRTNNTLSNLTVLTVQEHNNAHAKAEHLVFDLVKRGLARFNMDTKLYELV